MELFEHVAALLSLDLELVAGLRGQLTYGSRGILRVHGFPELACLGDSALRDADFIVEVDIGLPLWCCNFLSSS